jgi:hypothetical protein
VGAEVLRKLGSTIHDQTRRDIRYCRNKYGAYVDRTLRIDELHDLLNVLAVDGCLSVLDHVTAWLEAAACSELALYPLLFDGRVFASFSRDPTERSPAPYALTTGEDLSPGGAPPEHADAPYVLWVGGNSGHLAAPAVAGALAGRARRFAEHQAARESARPNRAALSSSGVA